MSIAFLLVFICLKSVLAIDYPWMYYLQYGKDVTLKPLFQNKTGSVSIDSCKWLTPENTQITESSSRFILDKTTCELTIRNNQKDTNGIYHCIVNEIYFSKAMLNVYGAPKETLLEEYTPNMIAGFSTAACIIAFFVITCSVYKFRYKEGTKKNKVLATEMLDSKVYFRNKSYQSDENQDNTENKEHSNIRF